MYCPIACTDTPFGLLANRNRKDNIAACHKMLGGKNVTKEKRRETWQEQLLRISGIDVTVCPICQKRKMCTVRTAASR